jgi:hypothetical protein
VWHAVCAPGTTAQKDVLGASKLKCALGLAALDGKKYKVAARKLCEVRGRALPAITGNPVWGCHTGTQCPVPSAKQDKP